MLIGGLGSLFFQMLHPYAHGRRRGPLPLPRRSEGRLLQTANFINATTYGSKERAHEAIERVLAVHRFVNGVADDGIPYDANDPHLLSWIHCAEVSMFLRGYQRYGAQRLLPGDADAYVADMMPVARALGVLTPPLERARTRRATASLPQRTSPQRRWRDRARLHCAQRGEECSGAHYLPGTREGFVVVARSVGQEQLGVARRPLRNQLLLEPAAKTVSFLMRLAVPAATALRRGRQSPPSTSSTWPVT